MSLAISAVVTAILLLVEHTMLWREPWRLKLPLSNYIVGVATLGFGVLLYCAQERRWEAAIVFWTIAITGGFADVTAHYLRSRLAILDDRAFRAGQVAGLEDTEDDTTDQSARTGY